MLPKTIKDAVDDEVFNFDIMLSNEISEHNVFNVILITIMKNDRYISQAIKCKFISEEETLKIVKDYFNESNRIVHEDTIINKEKPIIDDQKEIDQIINELSNNVTIKYKNFNLEFTSNQNCEYVFEYQNKKDNKKIIINEKDIDSIIDDLFLKKYKNIKNDD